MPSDAPRSVRAAVALPARSTCQTLVLLPRGFRPRCLLVERGVLVPLELTGVFAHARRPCSSAGELVRTVRRQTCKHGHVMAGLELGRARALVLAWHNRGPRCMVHVTISETAAPAISLPEIVLPTGDPISDFEVTLGLAFGLVPAGIRYTLNSAAGRFGVERSGLLEYLRDAPWHRLLATFRAIRRRMATLSSDLELVPSELGFVGLCYAVAAVLKNRRR